jgi:hypothetical protein
MITIKTNAESKQGMTLEDLEQFLQHAREANIPGTARPKSSLTVVHGYIKWLEVSS